MEAGVLMQCDKLNVTHVKMYPEADRHCVTSGSCIFRHVSKNVITNLKLKLTDCIIQMTLSGW